MANQAPPFLAVINNFKLDSSTGCSLVRYTVGKLR